MEGIVTKILLIVAGVATFVAVIVGLLQPAIKSKGEEVKNTVENTKVAYIIEQEESPDIDLVI
ncbi:hypothetical protein WMO40_20705 [Bacillaceae bacterium CLA-AA-H227]|uniref:Uncharacterized protein n=1 Tax=Robertmurraya yapensis (ex Hitch et al 2024) TaxID=3133160 RepID=A0ACC6SGE3_9BACI